MIKLSLNIVGIALDEAGASKLAGKVQALAASALKVAPEEVEVEVSVEDAEPEEDEGMTPTKFADQAAKAAKAAGEEG